ATPFRQPPGPALSRDFRHRTPTCRFGAASLTFHGVNMLRSSVIGIGLAVTALLAFQVGGCRSGGGGGGRRRRAGGGGTAGGAGAGAAGRGGVERGGGAAGRPARLAAPRPEPPGRRGRAARRRRERPEPAAPAPREAVAERRLAGRVGARLAARAGARLADR